MKRILLALALIMAAGSCLTVMADSAKEYKKEQKANRKTAEALAKKQMKAIKKEKWEYGGVLPLEVALADYYMNLPECGGSAMGREVEVDDAASVVRGEKHLLTAAQDIYAQEMTNVLAGEVALNLRDGEAGVEDVASASIGKYMGEFSGDIHRVILLKKRNGKNWRLRAYFLFDDAQGRARAKRIARDIEDSHDVIDKTKKQVYGE